MLQSLILNKGANSLRYQACKQDITMFEGAKEVHFRIFSSRYNNILKNRRTAKDKHSLLQKEETQEFVQYDILLYNFICLNLNN